MSCGIPPSKKLYFYTEKPGRPRRYRPPAHPVVEAPSKESTVTLEQVLNMFRKVDTIEHLNGSITKRGHKYKPKKTYTEREFQDIMEKLNGQQETI